VRPLITASRAGAPSDISRRHEIRVTEPGWIDVAGGKLTTYRLMAEQVVDRISAVHSRTAEEPIFSTPFSGILPPPVTKEVITQCCRNEWAIHLDDVLLRRTSWHFYYREQKENARTVAQWMAKELNWNLAQTELELERYFRTAEFIGGQ
jgi:glycerol-3-phosphate dehydrogenase